MQKSLAVILARKGSKRFPLKNIALFNGQPLIANSVKNALNSGLFEQVIVSTDCNQIAKIAISNGATVPFLRPENLALDASSSVDALVHATRHMAQTKSDNVFLIQPTSPMLSSVHLKQAAEIFINNHFISLSSMKKVRQYPEWMFVKGTQQNSALPLNPDTYNQPSDSFKDRFIENGAFYIVKTDYLLTSNSLYDCKAHGYFLMSESESIDIDFPEDLEFAVALSKTKKSFGQIE